MDRMKLVNTISRDGSHDLQWSDLLAPDGRRDTVRPDRLKRRAAHHGPTPARISAESKSLCVA